MHTTDELIAYKKAYQEQILNPATDDELLAVSHMAYGDILNQLGDDGTHDIKTALYRKWRTEDHGLNRADSGQWFEIKDKEILRQFPEAIRHAVKAKEARLLMSDYGLKTVLELEKPQEDAFYQGLAGWVDAIHIDGKGRIAAPILWSHERLRAQGEPIPPITGFSMPGGDYWHMQFVMEQLPRARLLQHCRA